MSTEKPPDPLPVRVGRLNTASDIRRACKRIGDAVLSGRIPPQRGNSALYAIATAAKAMEIEVAERMERRAAEIEGQRQGTPQLRNAIDALLVYEPAPGGEPESVQTSATAPDDQEQQQ